MAQFVGTTNATRLNFYLLGSALVAALGGFLFGFDTAVIGGTEKALRALFQLSDFWWGFTVASALIGTIIGSLVIGFPAERFGRKKVLVGLAVLYFVSALGCGFATGWEMLLTFRFLEGLAIGGASVVSPMYIAEIAPPRLRGRLVAVSQLNIVLGILVAYASNYIITAMFGSDDVIAWRWMLGIVAVPSLVFFFLLVPVSESPRWLVKQHRNEEALDVLMRLGNPSGSQSLGLATEFEADSDKVKNGNPSAQQVLEEIVESLHEERVAATEAFFQKKYRVPILLAFMVATFNQFAGINALIYYTPSIFEMAGAGHVSALRQSVVIGFTNLVFTLVAMSVIDRFGRKVLLLIGAVGLAACLGTVAFAFAQGIGGALVLGSLIGYIAFFAFSQGSVIWVYLSEIFPNRVRARGQALGSFTHWFWCAIVTWTFPIIAGVSKAGPFVFFAAMMVLQFFMVWKFLPETKGVSLEKIQRELGIE